MTEKEPLVFETVAEPLWLVEVAVPVPLRQTFTYRIPGNFSPASIHKGHRALVPFRSKLIHGITMSDAYQAREPPPRMPRALAAYDGDQRLLSPEIEALMLWIIKYYKAPVGEAVKLALPPGVLSEKEILFHLTPAGKVFVQDHPEETRLLACLLAKPLGKKKWETAAQAKIPFQRVRRWEDEGWLKVAPLGQERESVPHVSAVVLTEEGREADPKTLERAPAQRRLLDWLQKEGHGPIRLSEVTAVFKNGSALVKALAAKSLCTRPRLPTHELSRPLSHFETDEEKVLTGEQGRALSAVCRSLDQRTFCPFLIFGVTGSGKTEVYLRAIQHCLAQGRQALFLVPEIALTPLMQKRITHRFGKRLAILHSAVGASQRSESWAQVLAGKVDVVLGARSGVFAPLPRLGLIIVDEEHDQSYKQNDGIRYHARDLALVRAKRSGATIVLGSATPSLETWHNAQQGRSHLLELKQRATKAQLPRVDIIDMREEFKSRRQRPVLSQALLQGIERELDKGRQVMVLLNRRGYHSFLLCRKCGQSCMCSQCEVTLTFHQPDKRLKCHYCNENQEVPPRCPSCDAHAAMMQFFGEGTQQVQELLEKNFPDKVIDRLDRDRLTKKNALQVILQQFESGRTHILVGTQMIAKGHDFPNVTLVGIINADQGLRLPDFRCAEVTFQLITQVAGRSGRGDNPGRVVVQTYMPDHYSITSAAKHDFPAFLQKEMRYREHLFYSPFAHMVAILITHEEQSRAEQVAGWMAAQLTHFSKQNDLVVLGPAKAPIGKIKNAYRFQLVLKSAQRAGLHRWADAVVEETVSRKLLPRQAIILDIDPYHFF